ncbi:MAG: hypothetical protein ACREX4_14530 [Gammaproteobacteria bacterium]
MRQEIGKREMWEHRTPAIKCALALFMTLVPGGQISFLAAGANMAGLTDDLNRYAGFIGRTLEPQEVSLLQSALSNPRTEMRALSAALLFRADPQKYRADLASHFAVHDYEARAKGRTEMISQDEFVAKVKHLERKFPSLEPSLMLVVSFVSFRDSNLWFRHGDQNVSVSRFLRGAFFAQVFKGTTIDAVAVANVLDEEARRQYEHAVDPKR